MILSAIRPKADEYFGPPPVGQGVRITGVSAISGSTYYTYFTWISSGGQAYLFQGNQAANTPMYKYTLNGNIPTRDTGFNTGNLQYGADYVTSVSEPLNIMMVHGYGSGTTGTHHTIDLTTGQVIHTYSGVHCPCFWFESSTRGVMIYQPTYTSPIYASIVTFNGQVPTYGNATSIISSNSGTWFYRNAIRSGTQYFVTNSSNGRAMFDSSNSSAVSKAIAPEGMGCAFLMSPDVIRYYTIATPIGYYDYTISTNRFSAKQSTNIPSTYRVNVGYVEYNPIRKRYIMQCENENMVTAPDLSFTTDLQTFDAVGVGYGHPVQDVRTCYDDNGQWYAGYRDNNAVAPEAGAFTTAPVVMKKND